MFAALEPAEERFISGAHAHNDFRRKCAAINGLATERVRIDDTMSINNSPISMILYK